MARRETVNCVLQPPMATLHEESGACQRRDTAFDVSRDVTHARGKLICRHVCGGMPLGNIPADRQHIGCRVPATGLFTQPPKPRLATSAQLSKLSSRRLAGYVHQAAVPPTAELIAASSAG